MIATLALAAAVAQDITLRYTFQPGTQHSYELTRSYIDLKYNETTTFVDRIVYEVVSVSEIGVATLAVHRTPLALVMDDQKVPLGDQLALRLTEQRNRRGDVREREPNPFEATVFARTLRLLDILYPSEAIAARQSWTSVKEAGGELSLPQATWGWRVGTVTNATVEMTGTFQEEGGGMFGEGEATIDRKTGWPQRIAWRLENALVPGSEERNPTVLTITLERNKA